MCRRAEHDTFSLTLLNPFCIYIFFNFAFKVELLMTGSHVMCTSTGPPTVGVIIQALGLYLDGVIIALDRYVNFETVAHFDFSVHCREV